MALTLSGTNGVVGAGFTVDNSGISVIAGVGTLSLIGDKLEDYFIINPQINTGTAIFATITLILFGAIAGYVPAKRAADIKPIVALRDD